MELLKLSKFKLQLQSLISEVRDLRERERSVTDQLDLLIQKQKQTEEEYSRKVQELQAELGSSTEMQEKLERKVTYLQNDYVLLENKQNELKETIKNLLQSRESFLNAYQESTCEMKRSLEARDRKIAILYQKINSHLSLFDSIEKEALAVKQVVNNIQGLVSKKEDVVASLREKMDHVSAFEKLFIEKLSKLEDKIKDQETQLQRKDRIISELRAQLEAMKIKNDCQTQVEELQKTLSAKDLVIQNLISEKEELHSEVRSMMMILLRIQESINSMNEDDRRVFSSILAGEQGVVTEKEKNSRAHEMGEPPIKAPNMIVQENTVNPIPSASPRCQEYTISSPLRRNKRRVSPQCQEYSSSSKPLQKANKLASPPCSEHNSPSNPLQKTNNLNPFEPELVCPSPQSTCLEHQSTASDFLRISINNGVDKSTELQHQLDSECSTTQAEALEQHGVEH